ncbi:MAG: Glucose 1-dehydrogenase 4 [Pseudomonas citronellolis]|nr:MAG: Glucose 1-dehydrogenase 4 [Pseudomonas citronellolis]
MYSHQLLNEIVLVTGADAGIGQAIAVAFAREGADVVVAHNGDRAAALQTRERVEALGRRALALAVDLSEADSVAALFETAREQLGAPSLLVNAAHAPGPQVSIRDFDPMAWDAYLRANLYGPFHCCREFLRGLPAGRRSGGIINLIHHVEQRAPQGGAAQGAAEGGLRSLTRTLARELVDSGINVNNLIASAVRTGNGEVAGRRLAEPEEIAEVAVFLASRRGRHIHGADIVADGGHADGDLAPA